MRYLLLLAFSGILTLSATAQANEKDQSSKGDKIEERVAMIEAECAQLSEQTGTEIVAHPFENLLIDCARDVGAQIIVRGLRAVADFEYEFQMVGMNRALDDSIETVFLMAEARHQAIASKLVKEIARLNGDVSKFVTPRVNTALKERLG